MTGETEITEISPDKWSTLEKKVDWLNRVEVLSLASDLLNLLQRRTCAERFREQDGDRTRVSYARVLVSAIQAYTTLLRDEELENIKCRLEALENAKGR